jgi:hypothetical protein
MSDDDGYDYIEVKVYQGGFYAGSARRLVEQGVIGVLCGGRISGPAKKILDEAGIWYRENVEPEELESGEREYE